jgi:YD repeat-containing protein
MRIDSRITPIHSIDRSNYSALYNRAIQLRAEAIHDYTGRIARAIAAAARRGISAARSLLSAIEHARAARMTYDQLSRLSDRTLADIGITRGEIAAVAWNRSRWDEDGPRPTAATAVAEEEVEQKYRLAA